MCSLEIVKQEKDMTLINHTNQIIMNAITKIKVKIHTQSKASLLRNFVICRNELVEFQKCLKFPMNLLQ